MDIFREIGDWILALVEWYSGWQADPNERTKLQYIAAIFGIVAASCTIVAALYKFVKWLRGPKAQEESAQARALAEQLANQARERGKAEGIQEASRALSQKDDQIMALARTIDELRIGAARGTHGMEDALAMLNERKFAAAETLFTEIGEAKAAQGTSANKEAAHAFRNLGNIAFLHDTQKAMRAYARATELDPDDPEGWNQLGQVQLRSGKLDDAMRSFERVLGLSNRPADQSWIASATGNLGLIYQTRGDLNQAEAMHKKSLALNEVLGRMEGMAAAYGNLGLVYETRGDLGIAVTMHKKSLAIEEELDRKEGIAYDCNNLGLIYQAQGDLDHAEAMFKKSLSINMALNRKEGVASQYGNLGILYRIGGDLDAAEDMHKKSVAIEEALDRRKAQRPNILTSA